MAIDIHTHNKQLLVNFRAALYDYNQAGFVAQAGKVFAPDCQIHLAFPLADLQGPDALFELAYQPLIRAVPDLERRDYIVIAGTADDGSNWVGCGGFYTGVFEHPWLDIPPTGHPVTMRFHEFFRLENDRIVEMQALWDIPELMMQAKAWPMTPSLGVEWLVPGPATQDGISTAPYDKNQADTSVKLVSDMLLGLKQHADQGVAAMRLEHYWHPKMNWYGPAGIGSSRRISGFRLWHQIPFLQAMPDRGMSAAPRALFGDGGYVGFTAWPGMQMTLSGDGWLGIAPSGQQITMRSLDFWRCENSLIRENWVLVDLLDVYDQIGVDVFSRMRELCQIRLTTPV